MGELVNKLVEQGVEKWLEKAFEKIGDLADLARELGGDYVILLLGIWLIYCSVNKHLPVIVTAWSRDRKDRREHERKLEQIRTGMTKRSKKSSKKERDNAA